MLPFSKQSRILLLGGTLLLSGAVAPLLLPTKFQVEKSTFINAKPAEVFAYLNNPSQWENWSAWSSNHDPSLSSFYQGPVSGVNSAISWKGEQAGEGKAIITETDPDKQLTLNFYPTIEQEFQSHFILEPVENGTRLTWKTNGMLPGYLDRISGIWLKKKLARDFELSLNGLKKIFEPEAKKLSLR